VVAVVECTRCTGIDRLGQGYPRRLSPEERAFLNRWTDEA